MPIRRARTEDIDLVCAMRVAFLADHRGIGVEELPDGFAAGTRDYLHAAQAAASVRSWLATDENDGTSDRCAGVVTVLLLAMPPSPDDPRVLEGYVLNMFVVPGARRQGIGQALFDACLAGSAAAGVRRLFLRATDDGRPMYERAGFATDTVWMDLHLPLP